MFHSLKGVEMVSDHPLQYSPEWRRGKKGDPGEVGDGLLLWCPSLGRGIETVMDWGWKGTDSRGGRVLAHVCRQISSHMKVKDSHGVELWARGPHYLEDFPHGAELLLHAVLLDYRGYF